MVIHHYSHAPFKAEIEESGFLGLEACRLEHVVSEGHHLNHPEGADWSYQWRSLKKELKIRGRYLWFTEQLYSKSVGNPDVPKIRFSFDTKDIKVYSWLMLMDIGSSDKKRFKKMKVLSESGIASGDDPFKWWVSFEAVPLSKCIEITEAGYF
ncbi:hypothetical protein OAC78_05595 [Litorivicinus sp.]|jgi:hypothetical protein|nr:hypothetical protein [Litorivicinus sp.]MDB9862829.1 hypothetical protein [Litorivicinus sp.]MDC1208530.1 hypothetical protein [Litorivicinus sp.]MDC1239466.1 hypothetical protein [Litorivicinus sp.]MDC1319108.1 hypothetical protein [Litorivicinus sp.]|tara:strand:- start:12470 stop:12928 length:459 start_codon:yes stop_codon:yes gene_type:complete